MSLLEGFRLDDSNEGWEKGLVEEDGRRSRGACLNILLVAAVYGLS